MRLILRWNFRSRHGARVKWLMHIAEIERLMGAEDCRQVRLRHQDFFRRWAVY